MGSGQTAAAATVSSIVGAAAKPGIGPVSLVESEALLVVRQRGLSGPAVLALELGWRKVW